MLAMTRSRSGSQFHLWGTFFLSMLALASPWGCAGPHAARSEKSLAQLSLWTKVQVQPRGDTTWRVLAAQDAISSGDRFNVTVASKQPAYLYVALSPSDQSLAVLVPSPGELPPQLVPGSAVYAPGPGEDQSWTLDERTGAEHLYVIGAARPLSPAELTAVISAVSPTPLSTDREPPPIADSKNRTGQQGHFFFAAAANPDGVAVIHVAFQHK